MDEAHKELQLQREQRARLERQLATQRELEGRMAQHSAQQVTWGAMLDTAFLPSYIFAVVFAFSEIPGKTYPLFSLPHASYLHVYAFIQ